MVCFFAHDFKAHKPTLALLRKHLEYAPFFWEVVSADEKLREPELFDNVERLIRASHVLIGDVSNKNANVTLELGYMFSHGRPVLLLDDVHARSPLANLSGRLTFRYDPITRAELNGDGFKQYVASVDSLKSLRLHRPFLSYRLLTSAGLCTHADQSRLERSIPDLSATLVRSDAARIARDVGISERRIREFGDFFEQRLNSFNARSD